MVFVCFYFEIIPFNKFKLNLENFLDPQKFLYDFVKITLLNLSLFLGYVVQIIFSIENVYKYDRIVLFIKSVVYGPFMEEIIYRFIVFEIIRMGGYNNTYANLISSLIFGISIFILIKTFSFILFSLIIC